MIEKQELCHATGPDPQQNVSIYWKILGENERKKINQFKNWKHNKRKESEDTNMESSYNQGRNATRKESYFLFQWPIFTYTNTPALHFILCCPCHLKSRHLTSQSSKTSAETILWCAKSGVGVELICFCKHDFNNDRSKRMSLPDVGEKSDLWLRAQLRCYFC